MRHRAHVHLSRSMIAVLVALSSIALLVFVRELPAMRRYARMERM